MRRDEALQLPENLDYFAIDASLSTEVREKLSSNRPQTVSHWATTRLNSSKIKPFCVFPRDTGVRGESEKGTPTGFDLISVWLQSLGLF